MSNPITNAIRRARVAFHVAVTRAQSNLRRSVTLEHLRPWERLLEPASVHQKPLSERHTEMRRRQALQSPGEQEEQQEQQQDGQPRRLEASLEGPFAPLPGALFDFRSHELSEHTLVGSNGAAPVPWGAPATSPTAWLLRSDSTLGGFTRAQLSNRLHRDEDPVLEPLLYPDGSKRADWANVADFKDSLLERKLAADEVAGCLVFSGTLSLQTEGTTMLRSGYANIESPKFEPLVDLSECDRFQMRVRSCGGLYVCSVRTPTHIAYSLHQHPFSTPPNEWVTIDLPFSGFLATVRGKIDAIQRPFEKDVIESISFLMAQRKDGPFKLEIQWIRAVEEERRKLAERYTGEGYPAEFYQQHRAAARARGEDPHQY